MEDERERAGRELLALPPPPGDGPEVDWEEQKREMLDARMRKWADEAEAPGAKDNPEEGLDSPHGSLAWSSDDRRRL